MEHQFQQEMMVEVPITTPEMKMARALWVCYYVRAEEFDRMICKGEYPGIPENPGESSAINKHALGLRRRIQELAEQYQISGEMLKQAQATVTSVVPEDHEQLKKWMHQEDWHKTVMPLLNVESRRPNYGRA